MAIEISSWMRQNYKKGESSSAGSMKKTTVRMADGGDVTEAADKEAGLAASSGEKVGLLERLRMGNIDDPSSEAYRRFGAGRGREDRAEVDRIANRAAAAKDTLAVSDDAPAAPKMTAADFQRTDKDVTPVEMPKPRPARNVIRASASRPAPAPDQSAAETARLASAGTRAPVDSVVKVKPSAQRSKVFDPDSVDNFGPAPAPKAPARDMTPRRGYLTGVKRDEEEKKDSPSKAQRLGSSPMR